MPLLSQASNPNPPDGDIGVSRNVILSWTPGFEGALHNVYFGVEFEHVDPSNENSILVSQHQADTSYNPGLLDYGQTYYWRIDEVYNQGTIITGEVWSFIITSNPPKGRACFTCDTHVWIDGTTIAMSKIAAGQDIMYLDISGKVETVQEHEGTFTLYDIALESGNFITVAENHYFMSRAGTWLSLHDLKKDGRLKTSKGSVGIKSIRKRQKPYIGRVYNLKIKDSDQYMVGKDAVIVRDY